MTKDDAVRMFFENNGINPRSLHARDRIANLADAVDVWLAGIEVCDQPAFLEALSRYTYITQAEAQNRFAELVTILEHDLSTHGIGLSEVLYVTVESSGGIKSGGDNVRADMHVYNFDKIKTEQIIAAPSKIPPQTLANSRAIVFVDDLIGSGKTIWSCFHSFCSTHGYTGREIPRLYYMCLTPTERAIRHLRRNFRKYDYSVTPIYKSEWISHKAYPKNSPQYQILDKYETMIDRFFSDADMVYHMGFEKSCLLLSMYYNTPNNTVSSFWRPTDSNKPPFPRQGKECTRPALSKLKQAHKQSGENTYLFAADRSKKWNTAKKR